MTQCNKCTNDSAAEHSTGCLYEHFLSYMNAKHTALLCKAYFDGRNAPHDEYEAYMTGRPELLEGPVARVRDAYDCNGLEWVCKPPPKTGEILYLVPPTVAYENLKKWASLCEHEVHQCHDIIAELSCELGEGQMTNQFAIGFKACQDAAVKVCDDLYKHDRKESGYDEGWNDGLGTAEYKIRNLTVPDVQCDVKELLDVLQEAVDGMGGSYATWSPKARAVIAAFKEKNK